MGFSDVSLELPLSKTVNLGLADELYFKKAVYDEVPDMWQVYNAINVYARFKFVYPDFRPLIFFTELNFPDAVNLCVPVVFRDCFLCYFPADSVCRDFIFIKDKFTAVCAEVKNSVFC